MCMDLNLIWSFLLGMFVMFVIFLFIGYRELKKSDKYIEKNIQLPNKKG